MQTIFIFYYFIFFILLLKLLLYISKGAAAKLTFGRIHSNSREITLVKTMYHENISTYEPAIEPQNPQRISATCGDSGAIVYDAENSSILGLLFRCAIIQKWLFLHPGHIFKIILNWHMRKF
jgi:hypothetical protein